MTETYYLRQKAQLCMAYLSDPIFSDNNIFFYTGNPENTITLETKSVQFSYFSRKEVSVEVVGCPITIYDVETRIYFQEFNFRTPYLSNSGMRGYFVFENTSDYRWSEEIRILMYTHRNSIPFPNLDLSGREIPKDSPELMRVSPSQIPIKTFRISFRIMEDVTPYNFRAFGEVAEVYFLTKYYGFFNPLRTYWKVKNLVLMMEHLRRGKIDLENGKV